MVYGVFLSYYQTIMMCFLSTKFSVQEKMAKLTLSTKWKEGPVCILLSNGMCHVIYPWCMVCSFLIIKQL